MHKFLTLSLAIVATATCLSLLSAPIRDNLTGRSIFDTDSDIGIVEVAYLESTGTQYYLFPEAINGINCYILPQANRTYDQGQSIGRFNGGSRSDGIVFQTIDRRGLSVMNSGNSSPVTTYDMRRDHLFHVIVHGNAVEVDYTSYTMGAGWSSYYKITPFALFGSYRTDTKSIQTQSCRIGRCVLYIDDTLLYDLVPVRIGGMGCFYDLISGELFFNQGTGDFIIGPDL